MSKEFRISLRNQLVGAESTPWLNGQRARFKKAAQEAAFEMQDTKLRHGARVVKFNALIQEKLKNPGFQV